MPRSLIIAGDKEIERGNADLDPTTAWNLDLMYADEPCRHYVGNSDQPLQEEYCSWWGVLGVKFRL